MKQTMADYLTRVTHGRAKGHYLLGEEWHHRPVRCKSRAKKSYEKKARDRKD